MIQSYIEKFWYKKSRWAYLFSPLSYLFCGVLYLRRRFYQLKVKKSFPVPIIVVGNITVGGTGKTPLVLALLTYLKKQGLKPGVVSRGYGAKCAFFPAMVSVDSLANEVGDEPLLIAKRSLCPVVIAPKRVKAIAHLLTQHPCDVIISDDGLQHYAMSRDIEIAVINSDKKEGNGFCLPVGPLREPKKRLQEANLLVTNGTQSVSNAHAMTISTLGLYSIKTNTLIENASLQSKAIVAIAAIAHPERFFASLSQLDFLFEQKIYNDHYNFTQKDFVNVQDKWVVMTEKDAVKCAPFATDNMLYLKIQAELEPAFWVQFNHLLANVLEQKKQSIAGELKA